MSGLLVLPSALVAVALLLFRVAAGGGWLQHGLMKLRGGGWRQTGQWLGSMNVPPLLAPLVTTLETLGGIFLIVGLLVPIVGFLFLLLMAGIVVMKITKTKATFLPKGQGAPSYELDLVYLAIALALVATGAGSVSLDSLLGLY